MAATSDRTLAGALVLVLASGCAPKTQTRSPEPTAETPDHVSDAELSRMVERGRDEVEAFFGAPFEHDFEVRVMADRDALDAHWRQAWDMPGLKSQCWMVASGTEGELVLLSPAVWAEQACEHDPTDRTGLQHLVTHELAHVYHDQRNPRAAMEGLEPLGWFVEGLAVYVAGQLDEPDRPTAAEALRAGAAPGELEAAWSGEYRYSIAGSMVRFVDQRYGRDTVIAMLPATSEAELLAELGLAEQAFLDAWIAFVLGEAAHPPG